MGRKKLLLLIVIIGIFVRIFPIPELNSGLISTAHGIGKVAEATEVFQALYFIIGQRIPFLKEWWAKKLGDEINASIFPPDQGLLRPIILYSVMFFGREEFIVRLPALLFGIGCLLLIYQLGSLIFGVRVGLLSAFLLSLSLWHIKASSLPDTYTLFAFFSLLSAFFFYKLLKDPSVISHLKFILSSVLAFYSFYPILVIILAEFLSGLLIFRKDRRRLLIFIASSLVILLLIIPGLLHAYSGLLWRTVAHSAEWGWTSGKELLSRLFALFGGVKDFIPVNIFIFLFGALLICFRKEQREKGLLLIFLAISPLLFFLGCVVFFKLGLAARYFLIIYPFFIIISSYGILSLKNKIAVISLILIFNSSWFLFILNRTGFDLARHIPMDYVRQTEDFRFVAGYLKDNYQEGDAVVVERGWQLLTLQYYLDRKNIYPVRKISSSCGWMMYFRYDADLIKNVYGLEAEDGTPKRLKKIWSEHKRLFLIDDNYIRLCDQDGEIQRWIDSNYAKKETFYGGSIYLFDDDKSKKALIKDEDYQCTEKMCYLNCEARAYEIRYPFEKIR